jgi:outer membrane lipoprotein-sorting protein
VAAFGVIGATAAVASQRANADAGLPHRTASQLLADVQSADVTSLSGTVVQTADLGLPSLPGLDGGGAGPMSGSGSSSSLTSLLSGSHTWRVWLDGSTRQRLALVGSSGESDVIRNGQDLWLWSSTDKSAVHYQLPAVHPSPQARGSSSLPSDAPSGLPTTAPRTPDEAASQALALMGTDTTVTTSGTATVAGRSAYELVLTPKDKATRVASIRIAIDGARHVPLRVQVYSTKLANPAFEVGFTSIDFAKPDPRQFAFTPPPGTKVTNKSARTAPVAPPKASGTNPPPSETSTPPQVSGSGWSTVIVATLPPGALSGQSQSDRSGSSQPGSLGQLGSVLGSLPSVSGSWGRGHLLDGTLFSAVITDNGRIAVGAVGPTQLYAALAAK